MLAIVGFLIIAVILILLLTQRVHAIIALAGVPLVGAFVAGYSFEEISGFVNDGITGVVSVVAMFVFAIIFFGVLRDAGMFDPVVNRIIAFAGDKPATITLATTMLAIVTHLDGSGASTFLITIPAMLPLYERMGMSRLVLATCVALGAGVMNVMPWGGPTLRAAATADIDANDLWVPLIPSQIVGILLALAIAYWLGLREKTRLRRLACTDASAEASESPVTTPSDNDETAPSPDGATATQVNSVAEHDAALRRPKLLLVNFLLTVATVGALISGILEPAVCFIIGALLALVINYPGMKQQTDRINAHAPGAVLMASTLLAAGVLLGVLENSGMIEAMAHSGADLLPESAAPALPLIVGLLGVPMSLLFGPDAYYFGVMPVLMGVGEEFGVEGTHIAQASILGQETLGFPISPMTGAFFLLVGLAKVDIGSHIRHSFGWMWLISIVMVLTAVMTGVVPGWA